jgi:hypothetical protein
MSLYPRGYLRRFDDEVLAILRDNGPLTTREVAQRGPSPTRAKCGHHDCTRPDHQDRRFYDGLSTTEARQILDRLERKGLVVRTFERPGGWGGHLWALALDYETVEP